MVDHTTYHQAKIPPVGTSDDAQQDNEGIMLICSERMSKISDNH